MLLEQEGACWRVAKAGRAAVLVDMEAYFGAAKQAMLLARRSIHFLNWAFEPETRLNPQAQAYDNDDDCIAHFIKHLAEERTDLNVRVLCWKSAMPVAATQNFFPLADRSAFAGSRVNFVLDGKLPVGACHHQKMIIIDDAVAFSGSADFGPDRWDTPCHADDDARRRKSPRDHATFDSRHEVMSIVDGAAAAALGENFRRRWERGHGQKLPIYPGAPSDAWPTSVAPMFTDIDVGFSRTEAAWRQQPQVRECETLHLSCIATAKQCIYMENQYFTSELMAEALARRLAEPDGPQVVLISTERSPSYFDQMTMDRTRWRFIERLQAADRFGRFRIYSPVTTLGRRIIVHAKLTIIDDALIRIGSANLNNRSMGFDTEFDLSLEPGDASGQATVRQFRTGLLAHWLGCAETVIDSAIAREGGVAHGLEALRQAGHCRIRPITPGRLGPAAAIVAGLHLGDPVGPADAERPWRRKAAIAERISAAGLDRPDSKKTLARDVIPPKYENRPPKAGDRTRRVKEHPAES